MQTASRSDTERAARALRQAERTRTPIPPLSEGSELSLADAYAIQRTGSAWRREAGARLVGRKIGLTSRPMQSLLGVDEPDFGDLFDDMQVEDGGTIDAAALIAPKIEAEIAFVLDRDLSGPGVTAETARAALGAAVAALEVVDSRIADWRIRLADTVADNASSARFVLGPREVSAERVDLRLVGMVIERGGELVDTGAGAAALGDPVRAVAWLANALGAFGETLRAGDVVLSGALHRAFDVAPGDEVRAEFAELGAVHVRFGATRG